eukprot:1162128-Pelagomonas_calceolata.AAC.9
MPGLKSDAEKIRCLTSRRSRHSMHASLSKQTWKKKPDLIRLHPWKCELLKHTTRLLPRRASPLHCCLCLPQLSAQFSMPLLQHVLVCAQLSLTGQQLRTLAVGCSQVLSKSHGPTAENALCWLQPSPPSGLRCMAKVDRTGLSCYSTGQLRSAVRCECCRD